MHTHVLLLNDIDEVREAIAEAEERCAVAEAAFDAANTADADMAALNRAEAEYEAAIAELSALERRLDELEETAGFAEWCELRRAHHQSVL